jgi:hypothetical protein
MYNCLYEFTKGQCGACVESGCACKDRICLHVEEQAAKRGVRFPHTGHALRFIGPQGCIVPPHLRETCTIYLCRPALDRPGFDRERYEKIKRVCARIDWQLMELEDANPGVVFQALV